VADYWAVSLRVLNGEVAQMDMPGTQVRPGVWVGLNTNINFDKVNITGPVYIGSGSCVEDGATIEGPAWLGRGCLVRANSRLKRSVLFDYTRLSAGAVFEDVVASPQYCVDSTGKTTYQGDEMTTLRWGDARA
jgi:mannose-1-phosphate guanylyltransferase